MRLYLICLYVLLHLTACTDPWLILSQSSSFYTEAVMKFISKLVWPGEDSQAQQVAVSQFPPSLAVRPLLGKKEARSELPYQNYASSALQLANRRLSHVFPQRHSSRGNEDTRILRTPHLSYQGDLYFPTVDDVWSIYEHINNLAYDEGLEEKAGTLTLTPIKSRFTSHVSYEAHRIALHYKFDIIYIVEPCPEMLNSYSKDNVVANIYVAYPSIPIAALDVPLKMYNRSLRYNGWSTHDVECLPPIYSRGYSRSFHSSSSRAAPARPLIFTCLQSLVKGTEIVDLSCLSHDAEALADIAQAYVKESRIDQRYR